MTENIVSYKKLFFSYIRKSTKNKDDFKHPEEVHCGSLGFVIKPSGKVIIQKRIKEKPVHPNCWDFSVAEHLQSHENHFIASKSKFLEALIRGTKEELGIDVKKNQIIEVGKLYRFKGDYEDVLLRSYVIQVEENVEITLKSQQKAEVKEIKWIDKTELLDLLNKDGMKLTSWLKHALENNKKLIKWIKS